VAYRPLITFLFLLLLLLLLQVERTKVGQWLPVYTDIRTGRTKLITLVRKVSGDLKVR